MVSKKQKPRSAKASEKEQLSRARSRELEPSNQPLDALTIQQARLDPGELQLENVQQLQRAMGNLEVDHLLTRSLLNQRPNGYSGNALEVAAPRQIIQRTASQRAVTVTPVEKETLSGKICFDAVAYCLRLEGLITPDQYANWGNTTDDALETLVNTGDTLAINPNIPEENIVGIFRRQEEGGDLLLSHVMISLGGGLAIGSNNGCIGGTGDWSVQDIGSLLAWFNDGRNPRLGPGRESGAPDWARERVVYYRPVADAVASFE